MKVVFKATLNNLKADYHGFYNSRRQVTNYLATRRIVRKQPGSVEIGVFCEIATEKILMRMTLID